MSITIENPDFETMLAEVSARTGRDGTDLLVELLRREQARLTAERAQDATDAVESGRLLRERWSSRPVVDPRSLNEFLAYDENGLPS